MCRHLVPERLHQGVQPLQRAGLDDAVQSAPSRGEDMHLGAAHNDVVGRQEALLLAAREALVQRPLGDTPASPHSSATVLAA